MCSDSRSVGGYCDPVICVLCVYACACVCMRVSVCVCVCACVCVCVYEVSDRRQSPEATIYARVAIGGDCREGSDRAMCVHL